MPDLTEDLISYINTNGTLGSIHVGEVAPQDITTDYIWIHQSGETESECLADDDTDSTTYDVEVVSTDVAQCRSLTATLKSHLRAFPLWGAAFTGNAVQKIRVNDHRDEYLPSSVFDDDENELEVGSLIVTLDH